MRRDPNHRTVTAPPRRAARSIRTLLDEANSRPLAPEDLIRLRDGPLLGRALHIAISKGDFTPFYVQLMSHLGISTIADSVKDYIESTLRIKLILGPEMLTGVSLHVYHFFTHKKLFGVEFLGRFPAFYLNSDMWLVIPTGEVITLSHSVFFEQASRVLARGMETPDLFVQEFSRTGSTLTIRQLIQFQTLLFQQGILDWYQVSSSLDMQERALQALARTLDCPFEAIRDVVGHESLEFVCHPCREYLVRRHWY